MSTGTLAGDIQRIRDRMTKVAQLIKEVQSEEGNPPK